MIYNITMHLNNWSDMNMNQSADTIY